MKTATIMLVAGDPSGDAIAADLARALASALPGARFIGAGGPRMAAAGVANSFDLTADAVIGLSDALNKLPRLLRRKSELARLAAEEKPDAVVLVDFEFFNRFLARAIRRRAPAGWRPRIVKYVSPQVWASRAGRAAKIARDFDLLLCLFPFEKEWYARRLPEFRVEFVGHPMFDRMRPVVRKTAGVPTVLLLPGSRRAELNRHLPEILGAARLIAARQTVRFKLVAPSDEMAALARSCPAGAGLAMEIQTGGLEEGLSEATVAIASTGTVTLECASFGVPTVALYKTSLWTYLIARRIITVNYLSMPNILANEPLFPEFIQNEATASNIASAALDLLSNSVRRAEIQSRLGEIVASLGGPGAVRRAAAAIEKLIT